MPKYAVRPLTFALAVLLSVLGAPALAHAQEPPPGFRPFAPDSIWNLPLRPDVPLLPGGDAHVSWLKQQVLTSGAWINTTSCGMPLHWAAPDTPRVKVALASTSYQEKALMRAWQSVPIPPDARPANCADKNFAVLQQQPDGTVTQWEFWSATQLEDKSWVARWGGVTQDVLGDRGIASRLAWHDPTAPTYAERTSGTTWNVTATSVSMSAGVITLDDLNRGVIDHAVALAVTDAAKGRFLWPAQRSDGSSLDPAAIPEGARLRIDPSVNLDAMTMTPLVRMIAKAAQRYGIVVRDRTFSSNVFYVQAPDPGSTSPTAALLDGTYANKALLAFPWDRLQVLDAPTCTATGSCTVAQRAVVSLDTPEPRVGDPIAVDTANSALEHPRTAVEWDFDGDGTYEQAAGRAVKASFVPTTAGPRQVGVRITTRDGSVVTGSRSIDVAPVRLPVIRRPSALRSSGFYAYSSSYSALGSIAATTMAPDRPTSYRKLYSSNANGWLEVDFGGETVDTRNGATLSAWVDCTGTRCLDLRVEDAGGQVLGSAAPAYGTSGWVSFRVSGVLTPERVAGLRLEGAVRNATGASGNAAVSAVSLTVDGS